MALIDAVDHVVIAVRSLDDAEARFTRLGFTLTPRGLHGGLGTANHTIMLADMTYFEVLGVLEPKEHNAHYRDFTGVREGIAGIAMKSSDPRAVHAAFAGAPLLAGASFDFGRMVDLPEGRREARFTISQLDPKAVPGARFFVCQHHTPDVVWRKDMLAHANGSVGLRGVTVVVADIASALERYELMLGAKAARSGARAVLATRTCPLTLMTPEAFAQDFAGEAPAGAAAPYAAAINFKVPDRAAVAAFLMGRGIATRRAVDGAVLVPAAAACGTVLTFG